MKQLPIFLSLVLGISLIACGVKGPPIAPTSNPEPLNLVLDCSPYDKECDRKDPNYVPGLDPKNPEDAKKIQALESASAKKRAKTKKQ